MSALPFPNPQRIAGPGASLPSDITFPQSFAQQLFFSNGGATRYAFLVNGPAADTASAWNPAGGTPAVKTYIHVYKSSAGGAEGTWSEVGTLHAKEIPPANQNDLPNTDGFMTLTGFQVGSTILVCRPVWDFVTYASAAPHPLVVSQFDMDADDWGADLSLESDPNCPQGYITYGYYPAFTPFFLTQRASDGHIFLAWRTFDFVDLSFSGTDLVIESTGASESGADLFITGGGLVGSLSYSFVGGDVGKNVYLPDGGAAGFTPGVYTVASVDGLGKFTPDRSMGKITASGASWVMAFANAVSSASHFFDTPDLNRVIHITAGAGFATGFYGISAVDGAGIATLFHTSPPLNQAVGTLASSGGTWSMTNGTRNYERVMLSELSAGAWSAAQMVFGTVGEAVDHEPAGILPGDGDRLLLLAQKMTPVWNGNGSAFPTQEISTRVLLSDDSLTAAVDTLVTDRSIVGPIQSPMARATGGATEWLIPYVFVYNPSGTPTTVPCELRIMRAMSANIPAWVTTVIDTGVVAPPSAVNADFFDPEYNSFPVACDLLSETLYLMTPAPYGQGAPWFVPYLINLYTDGPPWDGPPASIWDESGITNDPKLGAVVCANQYLGSAYIGMLLSDGPVGEFAYDDPFYFELFFGDPVPLAITCDSPPVGRRNIPYSHFFPATGGTEPYSFAITAGALPTGLTLDAATGEASGTPTAAGIFTFTVQVADEVDATDDIECSITIKACLL